MAPAGFGIIKRADAELTAASKKEHKWSTMGHKALNQRLTNMK